MHQSDINADLLPSFLNVVKPLITSFSTVLILLLLSLFHSHTTHTAHSLLLFKSFSMSHKESCATCTQVYRLSFIMHLPIRQPSETMTPQTPILRPW